MAKFKLAGKKKGQAKSNLSALPCLFLVLSGFALVFLLFYAVLKSGS